MLYTRKGDGGTSGLFGTKDRLSKDNPVYEALGSLDELNSFLGFCRAYASKKEQGAAIAPELLRAQQCLFIIQAEIAGSQKKIGEEKVQLLEQAIGALEKKMVNPHSFVVPGSSELEGLLDCARAVSRRAERAVTAIAAERKISDQTKSYLNRLSSLLYALARYAASLEGVKEPTPTY